MIAIFSLFSVSFSFAADSKNLTATQEKEIEQKMKKICEGTVLVFIIALDSYFKNQENDVVKRKLSKRIEKDIQNNIFYTQYISKDVFIDGISRDSYLYAKKVMQAYPNSPTIYQNLLYVAEKETYPVSCQADMKEAYLKSLYK